MARPTLLGALMEYASDMLSAEAVRLMSLSERGMLVTMRWACWMNGSVPSDPRSLAKVLGLDPRVVRTALSGRVHSFFEASSTDKTRLICVELDKQRARMAQNRLAMSEGGKKAQQARAHTTATLPSAFGTALPSTHPSTLPRSMPASSGPLERKRTEPLRRNMDATAEDVAEMQRAFGEK